MQRKGSRSGDAFCSPSLSFSSPSTYFAICVQFRSSCAVTCRHKKRVRADLADCNRPADFIANSVLSSEPPSVQLDEVTYNRIDRLAAYTSRNPEQSGCREPA